ncbi:MAG: CidA/LrgA family protein [Parvibaculaceae bacterium]|jgi:holin-like protein|nr:CidA/LrgA family protein [Parvibaculaceae bacterium]
MSAREWMQCGLAFLGLTLLFLWGTWVQQSFALTIPGAVLGLLTMVGLLVWRHRPGTQSAVALDHTADTLLAHMNLFFVPAGVGVMAHLALVARDLWPIMAALVFSTLIGVATTGLVYQALLKKAEKGKGDA